MNLDIELEAKLYQELGYIWGKLSALSTEALNKGNMEMCGELIDLAAKVRNTEELISHEIKKQIQELDDYHNAEISRGKDEISKYIPGIR